MNLIRREKSYEVGISKVWSQDISRLIIIQDALIFPFCFFAALAIFFLFFFVLFLFSARRATTHHGDGVAVVAGVAVADISEDDYNWRRTTMATGKDCRGHFHAFVVVHHRVAASRLDKDRKSRSPCNCTILYR